MDDKKTEAPTQEQRPGWLGQLVRVFFPQRVEAIEAKLPHRPCKARTMYLPTIVAGTAEENAKHAVMLKNLLAHADIEGWQDYIWDEPGFWRFELGAYMSHEERDALIALKNDVEMWQHANATEQDPNNRNLPRDENRHD